MKPVRSPLWKRSIEALVCLAVVIQLGAQERLEITRENWEPGGVEPIPITLSGYSGEVRQALEFDLEIAGFEVIESGRSEFKLIGGNGGKVQGRLMDNLNGNVIFSKQYSGSGLRRQVHALSDEVVERVLRQPGIARTRIAYRSVVGGKWEIFVADYDGYNAQQVTKDQSISAAPTWVPGQLKLLYTSYKLGFPDIYSHDLRTGRREVIFRFPGLNTSAAVSPDGRKVAAILSKSGSPDLYVANIDGSELRRLTFTQEAEASPCWAPDGRTICFTSKRDGRARLFKIRATGGEMSRVRTAGVGGTLTEPDWSPDGKWIAFTAQMGQFNICVVPANGGDARPLVYGEDPYWAPNSRTLIFMRKKNGKKVLSLLDVPTKRVKDVRRGVGESSQASWGR